VGVTVAPTDVRVNVGPLERGLSLAVGALAGARALRSGSARRYYLGAAAGYLIYRGVTGRCPLYRALGVTGSEIGRTVEASGRITVQRPVSLVYRFLRDPVNFPRFSTHLESVTPLPSDGSARREGAREWRCRANFRGRGSLEWEMLLAVDEPDRRLTWLAPSHSPVHCALEARLVEGSAGTAIFVDLWVVPPSGPVAASALRRIEDSRLLRRAGVGPSQLLQHELRRLRQVLETGETATVAGQSAARERRDGRGEAARAAQAASIRPLPERRRDLPNHRRDHVAYVGQAVPWQPTRESDESGRR
jgi:uncharacterized membrane protein